MSFSCSEGEETISVSILPRSKLFFPNASLKKFSKIFDTIGRHLEFLEHNGRKWLMACDLKCNPPKDNTLSDIFLNCLPVSFQTMPKSLDITHNHFTRHKPNIDYALSCRSISFLPVTVCTNGLISHHGVLSFHLQSLTLIF